MSLKSWKKEFCPVSAKSAAKARTKLATVERDLRKWRGLTKKNLEKHGVIQRHRLIQAGSESFTIGGGTCGLCVRYKAKCKRCPLSIVRGGANCDQKRGREDATPYHMFIIFKSPQRMLYWLRRAKEMLEEGR